MKRLMYSSNIVINKLSILITAAYSNNDTNRYAHRQQMKKPY